MILLTLVAATVLKQTGPIDTAKAAAYFKEYKAATDLDGGKLWGKPLGTPIIFVDPMTRTVVTNQGDPDLPLKEQDGAFVGTLPNNKLIANYPIDWGKTQWAMIIWPVPENRAERLTLLIHESFHRIQPDLGFIREGDACDHLNTLEGRYWMQLEWRSLAKALKETGEAQKAAVKDSLLFRKRRYQLYTAAQVAEGRMERVEGTAAYTGTKLRGTPDKESKLYAAKRLEESVTATENLPRMFAYLTGPAYGFLLDDANPQWKKDAHQIPDFSEALHLQVEGDIKKQAEAAANRYDAKGLMKYEKERKAKIDAQIAALEKVLVKGPVLEAPMTSWRASTNALKMTPIGEKRIVHTYLVANTDWGQLTVDKAVLVDENTRTVYVPMPFTVSGSDLIGDGWKITLKRGWETQPGLRKGDMKLVKTTPLQACP